MKHACERLSKQSSLASSRLSRRATIFPGRYDDIPEGKRTKLSRQVRVSWIDVSIPLKLCTALCRKHVDAVGCTHHGTTKCGGYSQRHDVSQIFQERTVHV